MIDIGDGPKCKCYECESLRPPKTGLIGQIWNFILRGRMRTSFTKIGNYFNRTQKPSEWKQGVLEMKSSWWNERLPDEETLSDLEHGSRDIHLCNDMVENTKCPCNKAHLLHYRKEPLSFYRNAVWGTKCAIEDLLSYLEHSISNLKAQVEARDEELHEKSINLHDGTKLLATLVSQVSQREEHLMDCPAIDAILQMRSKGKIECKCGLLALQETITAVHKWLNGR